jgi:hypothetical protein
VPVRRRLYIPSGMGAGLIAEMLGCGTGGMSVRRDKIALVDECDAQRGACNTLTGEELDGGTGGTGSFRPYW